MPDIISRDDDAITEAAWQLAIDVDTGYTEGRERDLAGEIGDGIPAAGRGEVLRWLVGGVVSGITVGAVNMLDETDESTYTLIDEVADRLMAAVIAQEHAGRTLLHLLACEISQRERIARVLGSLAS